MNIYIDESGSINNQLSDHFAIALVCVKDKKKLERTYKNFVSKNYDRLMKLDEPKVNKKTGQVYRPGGKMFLNGKFHELKGAHFDHKLKSEFITHFSNTDCFDLVYIKINNTKLTNDFCKNTARCFNFVLKLALTSLIKHKIIPNEDHYLQLDERNERTESKFFLEDYLNTELPLNGITDKSFQVSYFDSANNKYVQIADVFANFYYSHLKTNSFSEELKMMKEKTLRYVFEFPL